MGLKLKSFCEERHDRRFPRLPVICLQGPVSSRLDIVAVDPHPIGSAYHSMQLESVQPVENVSHCIGMDLQGFRAYADARILWRPRLARANRCHLERTCGHAGAAVATSSNTVEYVFNILWNR